MVNIGGTVQKWLLGTLHPVAGERKDKAITILKQNQQKNIKEDNKQNSWSKLIDKYSKNIGKIPSNQRKIEHNIENWKSYRSILQVFDNAFLVRKS